MMRVVDKAIVLIEGGIETGQVRQAKGSGLTNYCEYHAGSIEFGHEGSNRAKPLLDPSPRFTVTQDFDN